MTLENARAHLVKNSDDAAEFAAWWKAKGPGDALAYDTESGGLDKIRHKARLAQFGDAEDGWAIPVEDWRGLVQEVFDRFEGTYRTANGPFDWAMSRNAGIVMPDTGRVDDLRPMHHPLESTFPTGLKPLAVRYVDPAADAPQQDLEKAVEHYGWGGIPVDLECFWLYSAVDAIITYQAIDAVMPRMRAECPKAYDLELSAMWVTDRMERYGAHIDRQYAGKALDTFQRYVDDTAQWCKDVYDVSPGSNQEVVNALVREGFDFTQRTPTGLFKLDKDILEGIDHPLAQTVLKRRQAQKLAKSYVRHFMESSDEEGILRCSINTLGPRTGRMSISKPALQQLPRFSEKNSSAIMVRNCISARPGHTLLMCDFDQIEMRVLAYLTEDPGMLAAFLSDQDFFISMACMVYGLETMEKSDPRRTLTKNTSYGYVYGGGVATLAHNAQVGIPQMEAFMQDFTGMFPKIKGYVETIADMAADSLRRDGVASVRSPLTGRRHIADRHHEYALVNYMVQGLAAEIFKMKLLEVDASGLSPWMMLPVHDEVILDVPHEHVPDAVHVLHSVMNDTELLAPVPIGASVAYGQRWGKKTDWTTEEDWRDTLDPSDAA